MAGATVTNNMQTQGSFADFLPPPLVSSRLLRDGSLLLRSELPVCPAPASMVALADEAAVRYGERPFLRERIEGGGHQALSFQAFRDRSRRLAQWMADRGIGRGDTVVVLCASGIEHAIFAMGAVRIGASVASLNMRFAAPSSAGKLQFCLDLLQPKLILAAEPAQITEIINGFGAEIAVVGLRDRIGTGGSMAQAMTTEVTGLVDEREAMIGPDDIARIVFTSGSSGKPKAVPHPHRMLMASVSQTESMGLLNFTAEHPHLLDGLPWHHIFGSNHNFNMALRRGVTITIDDGQPTPELFGLTLRNLYEVAPSHIATVPLALTLLCDALEKDEKLRQRLLSNLDYILFGGAGLNAAIVARLHRLAIDTVGRAIPVLGSYGSTEMQLTAAVHWPTMRSDLMGVPVPGCEFKLTPVGGKTEVRVRGPSVMPRSGYIGNPEATAKAFDADGFFCTGDAAILAETDNPSGGLIFDGRLAEEFKLTSGTWVSAGLVREHVLTAMAPFILEAVACEPDRDELGLLVWLNPNATAKLAGDPEALARTLQARIQAHNKSWPGLSMRIGRLMIAREALSAVREEITDKGSVNISRVWSSRAGDIARLFSADAPTDEFLLFPARELGGR